MLIEVEGERIAAVRDGRRRAAGGRDRPPRLHAAGARQRPLARVPARLPRPHRGRHAGRFWTWREQMYAAGGAARSRRLLATSPARPSARWRSPGSPRVGEFHYVHHGPGGVPYADPNAMGEAVIAAAREAGIRITLLDACYLHGGIGAEPDEVQRRFSDGTAERGSSGSTRCGRAPGGADRRRDPQRPRRRPGGAPRRSPAWARRARGAAARPRLRAAGRERGMPRRLRRARRPACSPRPARSRDRFTAVHATHLDRRATAAARRGRRACCLCPTTERDLADGIGPAAALRDAGVRLALGSDSHAVIDPFEEARAIELDERLASVERGHHGAAALLAAASAGGHASVGWPEAGAIARGRRSPTSSTSTPAASASPGSSRRRRSPRSSSPPPLPTSPMCSSAASSSSATARHVTLDVAAELRRRSQQLGGER